VSRGNCITIANWEPLVVNIISEVIGEKYVYKYFMTCLLYTEIKNISNQIYAFLRLFCSWFVGRLKLSTVRICNVGYMEGILNGGDDYNRKTVE
jgi:hypothetical protein